MEAHKIASAASAITRAEDALEWFGQKFFAQNNSSLPRFDSNGVATACIGYTEASNYMTAALRAMLPEILDLAARKAREDIAKAKTEIRSEMEKD